MAVMVRKPSVVDWRDRGPKSCGHSLPVATNSTTRIINTCRGLYYPRGIVLSPFYSHVMGLAGEEGVQVYKNVL